MSPRSPWSPAVVTMIGSGPRGHSPGQENPQAINQLPPVTVTALLQSGGAVCRRPLPVDAVNGGVSDPLLEARRPAPRPPLGVAHASLHVSQSGQGADCLLRETRAVAMTRCQLLAQTGVQEGRRRPYTARSSMRR